MNDGQERWGKECGRDGGWEGWRESVIKTRESVGWRKSVGGMEGECGRDEGRVWEGWRGSVGGMEGGRGRGQTGGKEGAVGEERKADLRVEGWGLGAVRRVGSGCR